jgi:Ni,Fe-hydrogenase I large subunit
MINRKKTKISIIFFLALLTASFGNVVSADSLDKKLEQCKMEFSIAHNKDSSQGVALAARYKHLKLMREILHELNKKNADKKLSKSELQKNVMVMSHLLEMLVIENLAKKEQTWNLNY